VAGALRGDQDDVHVGGRLDVAEPDVEAVSEGQRLTGGQVRLVVGDVDVDVTLDEVPFGGMAEKTLVRDALCLPVPDAVSDVVAAAILNPGQSPIGALRTRAGLQRGETVLINGATGTTGQVAVQIAKHLGAERVIVTGRSTGALARLVELGADTAIDLTADPQDVQDMLAAHFADGGIDIVVDYLSGPPTQTVLAAIASGHKAAKPVRYVIAGTSAAASTNVPTSVLGSASVVLMGAGIGAVRVPEILQASTEALQIADSAHLQIGDPGAAGPGSTGLGRRLRPQPRRVHHLRMRQWNDQWFWLQGSRSWLSCARVAERLTFIAIGEGEGESEANSNWWHRLLLSILLGAEMKDKAVMEAIVDASGLHWIIVRPPFGFLPPIVSITASCSSMAESTADRSLATP